jgi:hypothetical protein
VFTARYGLGLDMFVIWYYTIYNTTLASNIAVGCLKLLLQNCEVQI